MRALLVAAVMVAGVSAAGAQERIPNWKPLTPQEKEQRECGPFGCVERPPHIPGLVWGEISKKAHAGVARGYRLEAIERRLKGHQDWSDQVNDFRRNGPAITRPGVKETPL